MKIKSFQTKKAIFYLNEVYNVPYDVLSYAFGVSRATIKRIKKNFNGYDKEKLKQEIKEEIICWNIFNQKEFKDRVNIEGGSKIYLLSFRMPQN
ncbi:MAG: hypothetical protein ABDH49_08570 [Candidatus Hydrothermales bacterium]